MPPRRASPRGDNNNRACNPSTRPAPATSTTLSKPRAIPRTDTRDRARAPHRHMHLAESVQLQSSGSPPPPTRSARVRANTEVIGISASANTLGPITTPIVSPLSECESPVLPTTDLMPTTTQSGSSTNAGTMIPPALPKTPMKENVPMQQDFSGVADPTTPTPANKRRRVEDEPQAAINATPDGFHLQEYNNPGSVLGSNMPPALHAALLVRGPTLQMAQQSPGPGPDYPGNKVLTLRIVTHDIKLTSYTKSIVVHNPFCNGQIPAYSYIRHLCEQRWPEKHEVFRHMCDRVDMGMPNSEESYRAMAIRNAAAVGGPVAKGGPIRMMQLFGLEFIMEVCSEDEWGFFWDEVLLQEPENGLLTVFMAFHTKQ